MDVSSVWMLTQERDRIPTEHERMVYEYRRQRRAYRRLLRKERRRQWRAWWSDLMRRVDTADSQIKWV